MSIHVFVNLSVSALVKQWRYCYILCLSVGKTMKILLYLVSQRW